MLVVVVGLVRLGGFEGFQAGYPGTAIMLGGRTRQSISKAGALVGRLEERCLQLPAAADPQPRISSNYDESGIPPQRHGGPGRFRLQSLF